MARPRRLDRAALVEHAREAVRIDPDVTVQSFRQQHGGSNGDATDALRLAKYERGHAHYRHLQPPDFGSFAEFALPPASESPATGIDLAAAPEALAATVDRAHTELRNALVATVVAMRSTAERLIAEATARAEADVMAGERASRESAADVDAAEHETALARQETATVRQELTIKLVQAERTAADARGERDAAQQRAAALQAALDAERSTVESVRREAAECQQQRELAVARAQAFESQVQQLHEHLRSAREELRTSHEALDAERARHAETRAVLDALRAAHRREPVRPATARSASRGKTPSGRRQSSASPREHRRGRATSESKA